MSLASSSRDAHERYKTLYKVGEGSFGMVFRALDRQEGAIVALKRVRLKDTRALPTGALREIMALQRLSHPNVLPLHDMYTHGASLMLVLPFVPHNLASLLAVRDAPMPEAQSRTLARMLFQGLAACHAHRLLHRDLKPSNLLIDSRGVLLLADFGQARLLPAPGETGSLSHDVATRWYRAPELLLGARRYGVGVDLWAAGCIVAQLLSLAPLLPGDSDLGQLFEVLQLLGTPTEAAWPGLVELPDYHKVELPACQPTPLSARLPHATTDALRLVGALLRYEPTSRLTAAAALCEPWILHPHAAATAELAPPPPTETSTGASSPAPAAGPVQQQPPPPPQQQKLLAYSFPAAPCLEPVDGGDDLENAQAVRRAQALQRRLAA
tara:strand:- start:1068 stop:2213 length:1146 start_codon:yes stop_codon:yes gene_type:complete